MSCRVSQPDIFPLAATYVYEILKGTKPASTGGTTDEIRVDDQPEGSQADRTNDPAECAGESGSSN